MANLRPVPESPPRAVLYLRQSISHDDSISLELQEASCRAYCQQQGYQVAAVESDPGISGRTWKRPAVNRVMQMVEDGQADVVVLWKWSRLSRSRRDWALAVDRADVAGGRIESSTEAVDIGTATGRLTRGMLVELAAFESDRIGEVWKEVHSSRLGKGLVPNGSPRFGYEWDREAGIHRPHPVDGPALLQAYERFVAGEGVVQLVRWMNARGLKTIKGGPWSPKMLYRVLDSGFAAGQILWGGKSFPGAHEALVGPDLWQAYLDRREAGRMVAPRTKASAYLLSGLVKCGRCGGPMSGSGKSLAQGPRFRCNRNRDYGSHDEAGCTGGAVQMSVVENHVLEWLKALAADVDQAAKRAERGAAAVVSAEAEVRRATKAVDKINTDLQRLTIRLAEDLVPVEDYQRARDQMVAERDAYVAQIEQSARAGRRAQVDQVKVATGLIEGWRHLPVSVRRTMLGSLIDRIEVTTTRARGGGRVGGVSQAKVDIISHDAF